MSVSLVLSVVVVFGIVSFVLEYGTVRCESMVPFGLHRFTGILNLFGGELVPELSSLTLNVLYHTTPHQLCRFLLKDVVVGWLLNVPATCECISGTDLLRQFYVLPH